MINTGYAGELGVRYLIQGEGDEGPMFGAIPAEMPWLTYFRGLADSPSRKDQALSNRVATLGMWRALEWEPECAEKVLGWIASGSWSAGGEQTQRAHSGLLGPDGELL